MISPMDWTSPKREMKTLRWSLEEETNPRRREEERKGEQVDMDGDKREALQGEKISGKPRLGRRERARTNKRCSPIDPNEHSVSKRDPLSANDLDESP